MTSIYFVVRKSSKSGHAGSLTLRLIHQRLVRNIVLQGCHLYPHEWDRESQSIVYPIGNPERSSYLETIKQRIKSDKSLVESYVAELADHGPYCCDDIARLYRRNSTSDKLLGYAELLVLELERNGQERTARAYRTVTRGFVAFNKGRDIDLHHINSYIIKSFEAHLKSKNLTLNSISYYMRNLRAIYNKAVASKLIVGYDGEKPFSGVYTGVDKTVKRALTLEELKQLNSLDFRTMISNEKPGSRECTRLESLHIAWRMFFFCLYSRGMCFVDFAYLRKDNIKNGVIKYCRKKTGQQIEVKITQKLQEIINSFAAEVECSNYVFPIITDMEKNHRSQYENGLNLQNRRLKTLSRLVGIHTFSTHAARHSWATIGKKENLPLGVISESLGHSSEKTTIIYLGLLDNSVIDEANDHITSVINDPQPMTQMITTVM